ncbi:hypothetical protein ACFWUZ_14340 [Streptomyces sp. NPDC058646]|uniref:hypothetical protein n=1 Tax=Streptomyces sp. NPDC058646 TaxID=3346574 RepID=UPI0036614B28
MTRAQAPAGLAVEREMTIRLDARNRPELDEPTGAYAPAGIFRGTLRRPVPFGVGLETTRR